MVSMLPNDMSKLPRTADVNTCTVYSKVTIICDDDDDNDNDYDYDYDDYDAYDVSTRSC